jgi:hypothetical protein
MNDFFEDIASAREAAANPVETGFAPDEAAVIEERMRKSRRDHRMWVLQNARQAAAGLVTWIADGVHDRLDDDQQKNWDRKVADPARSMDLATRALVRVVAAEERLDEDAETRAARIAAEQAKRAEALRHRAIDQAETRKKTIRRTMTGILRDAEPDLDWVERELQLEDLFEDFEDDGQDPVEAVARLCARLGYAPEPEELPDGSTETPQEAQGRTMALARAYYDSFAAANGNRVDPPPEEEAPAPPARAQGPPG